MSREIAETNGADVSGGDLDRARRGAAQVFSRLVWLYTAGESTSIAEGEAERLLGSMAYVLGVYGNSVSARKLLSEVSMASTTAS